MEQDEPVCEMVTERKCRDVQGELVLVFVFAFVFVFVFAFAFVFAFVFVFVYELVFVFILNCLGSSCPSESCYVILA